MTALWALLLGAVGLTVPGLVLRASGGHLAAPSLEALAFGMAVLGAALLLAWAAEVAQLEISRALALGALALIAVLPEYAVDVYFAWQAANRPEYVGYATANMTGANRLLIGLAWPLVVALAWLRSRRAAVDLEPRQRTEVGFLGAATLYSFLLPLKGSISLLDAAVLLGLFVAYLWRIGRATADPPHLVGPARLIGSLGRAPRRLATLGLFLFSGVVIYLSAEPFAEALIHAGKDLGVDEFVLVQWLAPVASEAPEVLVAGLFALRLMAAAGLGALVSSKVNQWTLLVGALSVAYSLAGGQAQALPLDGRQQAELLLTAAQSLFAVSLLLNLRLALPGAAALLVLFLVQLVLPWTHAPISVLYVALGLLLLAARRRELPRVVREGLLGQAAAGSDARAGEMARRGAGHLGRDVPRHRGLADARPRSN